VGRKLYVGNLPFETTEDDLQQLFAQAGAVESVRVMRDAATGRARGFAFVEMASDSEAQGAIDKFHEQPFGGRALTVNEARPQASRGGSGGGRGGGRGGSRGRSEPRW
jgi:RNA recognition motif-containing protein